MVYDFHGLNSSAPAQLVSSGYDTFSSIVIVGNGFGFWNTIPIRRRTSAASTLLAYRLSPW